MVKYRIRFEVGRTEHIVRECGEVKYFNSVEEAVQSIKIMKQLKWYKVLNDKIIDIEYQEFIIETVVV